MADRQAPHYDGISQLCKNGNCVSLHIRRPFLHALKWDAGMMVQVRVIDGALVIRSLEQLLDAGREAMAERDRKSVAQVTT